MATSTIVALITPVGRSGIGVIRLSGHESVNIIRKLVGDEKFYPVPRRAALKTICDSESGQVIDEALVTYFKSPHSFTGEDVIEIACHGSPVLLRQIIDNCLKLNSRLAEAGEFSLRALQNGRMNLSQAEAIRDLIEARTVASARQSVRQLRGAFSNELQPLKDELLNIIVFLESALEFVEDDLPALQIENIHGRLRNIAGKLGDFAATFRAGRLIREGLRVALVGRPNVGKSSLFNAFLKEERAIVTSIAGTTRDHLHEKFTINNIPISLIDTAGLRETSDTIERIGVERSRRVMVDADIVVVLLDSSEDLSFEDLSILKSTESLNRIIAVNKIDLDDKILSEPLIVPLEVPIIRISAKTGEGLENLQNAIVEPFIPDQFENEGFLVTDARHHDLLVRTQFEIESSLVLLENRASEEIVLVGLHNAIRYLGEITGETTTEDVLTRIFSTFCIGK